LRLQFSYMHKIWYIFAMTFLSLMVKVSDSPRSSTGVLCDNMYVNEYSFDNPFSAEDTAFHLSSLVGEKDDETKSDFILSPPSIGFSFLFERFNGGKITQKAAVLSFILFETDSSPPYLL